MNLQQLKLFFRQKIKVVSSGPNDKTRGAGLLASLDALAESIAEPGALTPPTANQIFPLLEAGTGIFISRTSSGKILIANTVSAVNLPAKPAAPTAGQVDDTADIFSFLPNPLFPSFAQYKVNGLPGVTGAVALDATNSYVSGNRISVKVIGAVAKGGLAVYVAGSGGVPDGQVLTNADPFTGVVVVTPPASDTTSPTVSFLVPAPGATLTPDSQVVLTATANDNVAVAGLRFTNGATGAVIGEGAKNGSTYTFPYTVGAAGPLSLVATATDAAGNSQSATVNVTVGSTTPTPTPALTAALAISVASIVAGSSLTFEVTAGGGTAPYAYAVKATNNATGTTTILGSSASGSFTPQAGGVTYNIDATVTDAAGKVAQAVTRTVQVTAPQTVNQLPLASAGDDLTITAPTSSAALMARPATPMQVIPLPTSGGRLRDRPALVRQPACLLRR